MKIVQKVKRDTQGKKYLCMQEIGRQRGGGHLLEGGVFHKLKD